MKIKLKKPLKIKCCRKCNKWKVITSFHKDKQKPDGHHTYCKPCRIAEQKALREFKKPKQEHLCIVCEIDIKHLHINRLRCEGCEHLYQKERRRKYYQKIKAEDNTILIAKQRLWRKKNPGKYKSLMKKHNSKRSNKP